MPFIYIFSGLGADHRVFENIDFSGYNYSFVKWKKPMKEETIESYALRLTEGIKEIDPVLIGLSFGGIIAIEVAKLITTKRVIIIASIKTKIEMPFYYRFAAALCLDRILSLNFVSSITYLNNYFFGLTQAKDKKLLASILHETDPDFFRWAICKLIHWENKMILKNIVHIHGEADRIFPIKFLRADIIIKDGGHFMTVNKSALLTSEIKSLLSPV